MNRKERRWKVIQNSLMRIEPTLYKGFLQRFNQVGQVMWCFCLFVCLFHFCCCCYYCFCLFYFVSPTRDLETIPFVKKVTKDSKQP